MAYVSGLCKGIYPQNMLRILEIPLMNCELVKHLNPGVIQNGGHTSRENMADHHPGEGNIHGNIHGYGGLWIAKTHHGFGNCPRLMGSCSQGSQHVSNKLLGCCKQWEQVAVLACCHHGV